MDYPPRSFPTFCSIFSLQSFHPALVIKTYPTNLQGSFLMCIVRSHIRFCLYIFVFTLPTTLFNQFTQPNISFLLSTINQTCLFGQQHFFNQFSQLLCFFSSNHLPPHFHSQFSQTILFFATISSASNHLNQFLFPIQPFHWVSLPSPPPPLQFFGKTFHFLCFH